MKAAPLSKKKEKSLCLLIVEILIAVNYYIILKLIDIINNSIICQKVTL